MKRSNYQWRVTGLHERRPDSVGPVSEKVVVVSAPTARQAIREACTRENMGWSNETTATILNPNIHQSTGFTIDLGYPYGVVIMNYDDNEHTVLEETSACCRGCEDAGRTQTGHLQCSFDALTKIKDGAILVAGPILTDAGWKAMLAVTYEEA